MKRILITKEIHRMWRTVWRSTTAIDTIGRADLAIVTRHGGKFTAKDRPTVKAILAGRTQTA